jgi:hypothetical protein
MFPVGWIAESVKGKDGERSEEEEDAVAPQS